MVKLTQACQPEIVPLQICCPIGLLQALQEDLRAFQQFQGYKKGCQMTLANTCTCLFL